MRWQLIETAPKNGRKIILFVPSYRDGYRVCIGHYSITEHLEHGKSVYKEECWWTDGSLLGGNPEPSHWMPLPEPPGNTDGVGGEGPVGNAH